MTIPLKTAQIHWRDARVDGVTRVGEVWVFDRTQPQAEEWPMENSSGAASIDWMEDPRCTPEGIYLEWTRTGFASDADHVAALLALAEIEGLEWPSRFASALIGLVGEERED